MGREDRVLCLIVDGEPNASDKPECDIPECFPESLRFKVDTDGQLTDERTEPIAADVREGKDNRHNARLKLLAGLLGINYSTLNDREKKRRFWKRLQVAVMTIAILALGTCIWVIQEISKMRQAEEALYYSIISQANQSLF